MFDGAIVRSLLRRIRFGISFALLGAFVAFAQPKPDTPVAGGVFVTAIDGVIGVSATRQITRAIERAELQRAAVLILQLDTPGGLVSSTRQIVKALIASPVPVAVFVAPSGARAASAGTFIVYAAHVAAMAPGTNLGAATPISLGGVPGMPGRQPDDKEKDKASSAKSAAVQKAMNDAIAMLRSLAQLRGRDVEFAEKAVRDAATLTANEAQKQNVVEILASSIDDLRAQLDGRKVSAGGVERVLATKDATVTVIEPDWRSRALSIISDPNIAFLLLMIGFYGIILEFWNPGALIPGVVGGISLLLALTGLSALPLHFGALALLVLGIALMLGEAFTPGVGVLGIGGLAAFVVGSFFLFDAEGSDIEIKVSLPLIIGAALTTAALIFGVIGALMKSRKRPPVTGAEEMIGLTGQVVEWSGDRRQIRVHGELWSAQSEQSLQPRETVRVVGRNGLVLIVSR